MAGFPAVTTFTADLATANTGFTISEDDGISQVSIYNGTATTGFVTGTKRINNVESDALDIPEGVTVTLTAPNGMHLDQITLTIPSGCILSVIAN